jgi:uncharacterized protein YkwD
MVQRGFFSHMCPDGLRVFDRIHNMGIPFMGAFENLAMGHRTPQEAVNGWMGSPSHREAILDERLTHLGVGFHDYHWTQVFIG